MKPRKSRIILTLTALMLSAGIMSGAGVAEAAVQVIDQKGQSMWTQKVPAEQKGQDDSRSSQRKKVAIIIDDFGNGQQGTEEMLAMPIKLTVAIMPFLPTSGKDAELAYQKGHDVIVHMPMEPKNGRPEWLGPGAITTDLTDAEIRKRVEAAIDHIPHAIGMNNHMGSKVTGDERVMSIVLDVCRERGLFFVDSKTNYRSIVGKLAAQKGMPQVANNIFLDDIHKVNHISGQMELVRKWASDNQYCITIGHVGTQGKKTAQAIADSIPRMKGEVQFVGIGELVQQLSNWVPDPSSILPLNNK